MTHQSHSLVMSFFLPPHSSSPHPMSLQPDTFSLLLSLQLLLTERDECWSTRVPHKEQVQ
ncbi:hypothetical protein Lalb_Chr10g0094041 [Lupinus albus]|uniref:Uncharacterized protein n=1 Tax=Lupinus albus TaxID=3870 RepID=A0A6A4PV49_LUPAL|nr:hypothetical protein Lalb_Chr10g0094041 [Lupinus albus]